MSLTTEKPFTEVDLEDGSDLMFFFNNSKDNKLNTSNAALKAMLYTFAENSTRFLNVEEILNSIIAKLPKAKLSVDVLKTEILANLVKLIFSGYVSPTLEASKACYTVSEKPLVSEYVRAQLNWNRGVWVTSELHGKIALNILDGFILRYLDGKHTEKQILEKLVSHVKEGALTLDKAGKKITEEAEIIKELEHCVKPSIEKYIQNSLLIG